jgi:hypothetical protein
MMRRKHKGTTPLIYFTFCCAGKKPHPHLILSAVIVEYWRLTLFKILFIQWLIKNYLKQLHFFVQRNKKPLVFS